MLIITKMYNFTKKLEQLENLVVVDDSSTNDGYGYNPFNRPLNILLDYGLILIDKPSGPTSHEIASWVKRILKINKTGHSGTLDPGTTGLLPMGLGEATKALSVLLLGPKEYYSVSRLHSNYSTKQILSIIQEFTGDIFQKPPQRSSVKRETRIRRIYELDLLEKTSNLILLRTLCESGTYIRKLIYDIGELLGSGATMVELRRTRVSKFSESNSLTKLHDLHNAFNLYQQKNDETRLRDMILPIELCLSIIPSVIIRDTAVDALCHGAQLAIPGITQLSKDIRRGSIVGIYTIKGEIVGLATALMDVDQILKYDKGVAFSMKRLIMKPNTYQKGWK